MLPALAMSITSWKVRIGDRPSNLVLAGRSCGSRSRHISVFNSARLKSSVNQPLIDLPSITLLVRRAANSGRLATSVVAEISFSCRATRMPSWVGTRSGSMKSAPSSMASS